MSFVRPRELVSFDPRHLTRFPPIAENVFELGGIINPFDFAFAIKNLEQVVACSQNEFYIGLSCEPLSKLKAGKKAPNTVPQSLLGAFVKACIPA